ncbi:hypothetical protein [Lacipirellula parvula]|uniref:Uncharacterized protein n=1 Tax=Lacipirellula parvula TaxID=2650471 RepID=A0A5K7X4G3_9BACT|nr:hypothetical protein [Lacipirellula parvula]BBO31574.1 hypothetical protein PLANPX_1186 [Lacipirellula parvula]
MGTEQHRRNLDYDELSLLIAAESRIDIAMSKLIATTQGVTDATTAQVAAISELREARDAIRVLRDRLGRPH